MSFMQTLKRRAIAHLDNPSTAPMIFCEPDVIFLQEGESHRAAGPGGMPGRVLKICVDQMTG